MYLPALASLTQDFAISIEWGQATITTWIAGLASLQLLMGPLSDRFGRRPVLLLGGVLFLFATACCAWAPSIGWLLAGRFFQGIGICSLVVSGYAVIHESYEDRQAVYILSWMNCITIFAPMFGPLFGGYVLEMGSWRMIFWLIFGLTAMPVLGLAIFMPESNRQSNRQALSVRALKQTYLCLFTNSSFVRKGLTAGCLYGGMMLWIAASPFLLIEHFGFTPMEFGYWQVPIFIAYAAATRLVTPLRNKMGADRLIQTGLSVGVVSIAFLVLANLLQASYILAWIIPMMGLAACFGLASAPLNRAALLAARAEKGAATALFYFLMMGTGMGLTFLLNILSDGSIWILIGLFALSILAAKKIFQPEAALQSGF